MNNVVYPDSGLLYWWIGHIERNNDHYLKPFLPKVDKEWGNRVMRIIDLMKLGMYPQDLHSQGAFIFYKINKAHNEIDSNKRTSIIVTYLFYIINNHTLIRPPEIRLMAKRIARSKGRRNQDSWIRKAKDFLSSHALEIRGD